MPTRTAANPLRADPLPYQEGYQPRRGMRRSWEKSNIRDSAADERVFLAEEAAQREVLRKQNIAQGGVDIPDAPTGSVFRGIDGASTRFRSESGGGLAPRQSFAADEAAARQRSALSGAFGSAAKAKAENLEGRKGLFAEMKEFAAKGDKATPEDFQARVKDRERAKALGLSDTDFDRGLAKASGKKFVEPTKDAPPIPEPITGRALAEKNIRTKGQAGAVADYFKRSEADKAALQKRQEMASRRGTNQLSAESTFGTDDAPPSKSFASSFGSEVDRDEPSPRLVEARKNAVAAREKATSMRAEYERGLSPSAPTPAPTATAATSIIPPRAAPPTLFAGVREDAANMQRAAVNTVDAAERGIASGVKNVGQAATDIVGATGRTTKELADATKKKAISAIPGRTGDYFRSL